MKTKLLLVVAVLGLTAGCSTTRPEQTCRDRSDTSAAISVDYCVWNKKTVTSNDDRQRTTAEWNTIVTWPSAQQRIPASKQLGGDRVFR